MNRIHAIHDKQLTVSKVSKGSFPMTSSSPSILISKSLSSPLSLLILLACISSSSFAEPQTQLSAQLSQSGSARIHASLPFISGWDLDQNPMNNSVILRSKKERYVLSLCASWCKPCMEGLKRLSEAKERFKAADTDLVIYVVRDDRAKAMELRARFKLDWARFIVDEYGENAKRLTTSTEEGLTLPRTFVLDRAGVIQLIIGKEGEDFIELLLGKKERR